jgi:hypothetical protein
MPYKFFAVIPLAVFLASCASVGPKPEKPAAMAVAAARPSWIDGAAAEYPAGRFLTGVASSDDPAAAKDRARGEISKVFSTQITINTAVTSSEYSSGSQGKSAASSAQNVSQNVRAISQKNLEGVEIARTWRDGASGQYYALAVLERSKALAALEDKMRELDAQGRDAETQLAAAAEKLQKAKYALKLMDIPKAREALTADMRVLDPANVQAPGLDVNAAKRDAARALSALDVALVMSAESSGPVAAAVIKALNGLGIEAKTAASAVGADIAAECSVEFAAVPDADSQSRWRWCRGAAAVELKDPKTSRIFLNFDASVKEASSTAGEARLKAETALGRKIGPEILRGIAAYLENK